MRPFSVGYGLGAVEQTNRNIPYLGGSPNPADDLSLRKVPRLFPREKVE
jgi:hypothetical protein